MSHNPGIINLPVASTTCAPFGMATSPVLPSAEIRLPVMTTVRSRRTVMLAGSITVTRVKAIDCDAAPCLVCEKSAACKMMISGKTNTFIIVYLSGPSFRWWRRRREIRLVEFPRRQRHPRREVGRTAGPQKLQQRLKHVRQVSGYRLDHSVAAIRSDHQPPVREIRRDVQRVLHRRKSVPIALRENYWDAAHNLSAKLVAYVLGGPDVDRSQHPVEIPLPQTLRPGVGAQQGFPERRHADAGVDQRPDQRDLPFPAPASCQRRRRPLIVLFVIERDQECRLVGSPTPREASPKVFRPQSDRRRFARLR